jgi:hypothetical protein
MSARQVFHKHVYVGVHDAWAFPSDPKTMQSDLKNVQARSKYFFSRSPVSDADAISPRHCRV